MFMNPEMICLLLHRVSCESSPDVIKDVLDGAILWRMLNSHIEIDGEKQQYKYGDFDTDVFLALTVTPKTGSHLAIFSLQGQLWLR